MKNKIYKVGLIILTLALYFYINIAFSQDSKKGVSINENSVLGKSLFSKSVFGKTDYISPFIIMSKNVNDNKVLPVKKEGLASFDSDRYFEKYYNTTVLTVYPNYAIVIKLYFNNQDKDLAYK
jgi:hypothetical protein